MCRPEARRENDQKTEHIGLYVSILLIHTYVDIYIYNCTHKWGKMAKFILHIFYHNKEKGKKKVNALQGNKTMTFGINSSRRTKVICN